ncbi:GAS2-like protein 1 [Elsinoe australis]|uniref:GAS2-like protein 1 n=1 Tax=Elsinoe australis TaxID=40998 RepID=A0A2P7YW69_9PEZI|nr:GAS2-like protein 1 [Elsinoe australis]
MALPNPTINPPLLQRPGAHTPPNRSPSISPVRSLSRSPSTSPSRFRLQSISQDPILRDLSPTKTLRALSSASHTETESDLMKSVEHVSGQDRAFGVRVAQTCKDLREWAVEVEAWEWPGTFEPPSPKERSQKRKRMLADHRVPQSHFAEDSDDEDEGFWGSLPKELVLSYEARIDAIQQAMEDMDVEGLKNHVRNVHILPKANSPKQDEYVSFRVRSVDDYTTLITATILQALPYLSWLTRLLNEWSIRLLVLRKVPGFLSGLDETQKQLDTAWSDFSLDKHDSQQSASPVRSHFQNMQTVLGSKVSALGQRLDSILDELEGRSETIPDSWIDHFESLELAYSNWVVKAERTLTGLAWEFDLPGTATSTPGYDALGIVTEPQDPVEAAAPHELEATPVFRATDIASKGERRVESPTLGERPWHRADSNTTIGEPPIRVRQDSEFVRLVDDVILESQDQATSPILDDQAHFKAVDFATMAHPAPPPEPEESQQPPSPAKSPRLRARHVPIDVEAYREAAVKAGITPREEKDEPFSLNREPPLPAPTEEERPRPSVSSVAARRAMFNGDLENKQILLKASSPVRPFEHASNAFTKLFKPASREPSRTRSNASKATPKRKHGTQSVKSRTSFTSKRASDLSIDAPSTRERIKKALEGTVSDYQVTETTGSESPERRTQSAHQNADWSDKEVVVSRPLSEGSPAINIGKFDSPLTAGQLSDHWPFPAGMKMADEEISSPGGAIRSDAFEQMFVDTLPVSPILDDSYVSNLATFDDYINRMRRDSTASEASLHDEMVDGVYIHAIEDIKGQRAKRQPRSRRTRRQKSEDQVSQIGNDSSSMLRSQASTPEIVDASSAGFFKPHEVNTPRKHRTKKKSRRDKYGVKISGPSRKQSYESSKARVFIDGDNDADRSGSDKEAIKSPKVASKRASMTTMEEAARAEVYGQRSPNLETESTYFDAASRHKSRDRSDTTQSEPAFPVPPSALPGHLRTRSAKDGKSLLQALRSDSERSIVAHTLGASKPPPLAFGSGFPQSYFGPEAFEQDRLETHAEEPRPATPQKSEKRRDSISSSNGDYMDRHVSQVLRNMTSTIHFSTRPGRTTPTASSSKVKPRPRRDFTLAPATPSQPSLNRHVKDGETKLYHLSQPGKDQPIKLFIRLVGNDERVMVRVGGGWMDLEEYLRQYAEHHTHRTVGGSGIEVTEASRINSDKKKTPESRYQRPESALGFRYDNVQSPDLSSSPSQHNAMDATPDAYTLNHPTHSQQGTPLSESVQSPLSQGSTTYFDVRSTPSAANETPSSAGSPLRHNPLFPKIVDPPVSSRPTSIEMRSASGVKPGLDAQKARWVEDMISRTKQSAGEKSKEAKRKELQELGKAGSTRRLGMSTTSWRGEGRNANKW